MWRRILLGLTVSSFLATQVQSAVLLVDGLASVDKGDGFKPAASNVAVSPGDRVLVTNGCAHIVYENGYNSRLCKPGMAVVLSDPPSPASAGSLKDTPVYAASTTSDYDLAAPALFVAGAGLAAAIAGRNGDYGGSVSP